MKNLQKSALSFSVLIAAKNSQATIGLAVKSTLLALNKDDEVLVFLDGCDDGTHLILNRIRDPRLKVHGSQVSIGRSAARNFLSLKAQGSHFAVLDSDDVSLPWRFLMTRRLLRKYDAVFGAAFLFGDLPYRLPMALTYPLRLSADLAPAVLSYRNPFVHSTSAFKRDLVTPGKLYEEIVPEEYLLWIQMALAGFRLYRTPFPLVGYRLHAGQISRSKDFYQKGEECALLNEARDRLVGILQESHGDKIHSLGSENNFLRELAQSRSLGVRLEETLLTRLRAFAKRLLFWRDSS